MNFTWISYTMYYTFDYYANKLVSRTVWFQNSPPYNQLFDFPITKSSNLDCVNQFPILYIILS